MTIVQLEVGEARRNIARELPEFPFQIGPLRFTADEPDAADWMVMGCYVRESARTYAPLERRILLMTEPSGYYPPDYANQFGILISPFRIKGFRGIWYPSHGAPTIFFGVNFVGDTYQPRLSYHDMMALQPPPKDGSISVVISKKSVLPGHRRRLRFVEIASKALGERLQIFGRGFKEITDKADAILPHKYHLSLENTVEPAYWTEKVADAFIGWSLPIVSGPPDLDRWFPADSFVPIDIGQPQAAIDTIRRVLDEDIWAGRLEAIRRARHIALNEERICPLSARVIAANPSTAPRLREPVVIHPVPRPPLLHRIRREAARSYWKLDQWVRSR